MKRKIPALLLALVLIAGIAAPAFALEATETASVSVLSETITIHSTEEWLELAKKCSLDTWSLDKTVVLQADISLSDTEFATISTFGGTLEGNDHTISGLVVEEGMAPAGLFRYLQPTAVVRNLKVSGRIAPGGDASTVGGIVGENHGAVENCAFTGEITGERDTGGIAGANYGTIRRCKTSGSLTGDNRTGGVAGYNEGTIDGCENSMEINIDSVDPTIDPTDIDFDFNMDLSRLSNLDTSDAAKDTGGIAGYSAGIITNCTNTGNVGYPHIGYNLGGIAGRNCGFVSACRNSGHIQGRKDAGGIVGQIEPNIATILSPDYLETLSKQFENLGSLVSAAGSHAAGTGDDIQSYVQAIAAYQSSARAALDSILSGLANDIKNGQIGGTADAIHSLGSSIQGMINATNRLKQSIVGGVAGLSDDVDAISGQISSISRTFALATEDAKKDTVSDISDADLADISEGKVHGCTNSGTVEGDLNTGGIVGIMGLEYEIDPEDDAPSGKLTQRRRYELKAIVQDCVNTGAVTGKRSYVGSICGRMELGMISASQGYGTITSENGDYVGGIAGMTGGTIRNCFAKCTLSGGSYIGGIVGSGIAEDLSGESSTVTGCYSMVEITGSEQYTGSISGAYIGNFTGNYFVSDTLAGINGISYSALAEPISFDTLLRTENLPRPLRQFTLSFVADGETIKAITFDYGDSFDSSVFPEIPQKEGYYAQWSTRDLTDLRFDTVVEASYYPYITSLYSTYTRQDGKPMLFVQGQFKDGDSLRVDPGTTAFPETESHSLLEQWQIAIPADGLENHSIRYLPAQENTAIYLLRNGSWSRISTEEMGSYLTFTAAGAEIEIAVTTAHSQSPRRMLPAAAAGLLLVLILLIVLIRKSKTKRPASAGKKKRWLIPLVLLLIAAAAVCFWFSQTNAGQSIQAYDVLTTYLEQPELQMDLTVKAQIADKDANFTAQIRRTKVGDTPVSVISESGRKLYYADGVVLLENGAAYRLNSAAPDYSGLLEQVQAVYAQVEIDAVDGVYTVTAEEAQAAAIAKLLMPSAEALLSEANSLTVDLITENQALTQIRFTGAGNLADSVKTPFSVSAAVDILPVSEAVSIPKAVAQAVASGNYQAQEIYSDDLVRLMNAWTQMRSKNPIAADVLLETNCGQLTIQDAFSYYQWRASGTMIQGVEKDGKTIFFTDSAVCDEQGRTVSAASIGNWNAATLLDVAYQNFSNAEFGCRQDNGISTYTVTLDQAGLEQLMYAVFSKAEELRISCEKGTLQLAIADGQIQSVAMTGSGSGNVLSAVVDARISAEIRFRNDSPGPALPEAVKHALHTDIP